MFGFTLFVLRADVHNPEYPLQPNWNPQRTRRTMMMKTTGIFLRRMQFPTDSILQHMICICAVSFFMRSVWLLHQDLFTVIGLHLTDEH